MEVLIFIALIVILVLLLTQNSKLHDGILNLQIRFEHVVKRLESVTQELSSLKEDIKRAPPAAVIVQQAAVAEVKIEPVVEERPDPLPIVERKVEVVESSSPVIEQVSEEKVLVPYEHKVKEEIPVSEETIARHVPPKLSSKPIPQPTFFERNPDLEKFIGENLINKIGIAILVLGIGFFVKYAIDQNWINEIGRVAIGIMCGGILLGVAHYLRKTFKPFSSVLVGGGLAVFYFTIAIAFQEYQIFSKEVAFGLMILITAFAVLLAIAYDRIELAIVAIVGGFSSPFFVSDGSGNYVVMFSYVLILNVGMLVLAYFKRWNLVNIVSYAFTVVLYGGWLTTKVVDQPNAPYLGAFVFGTLYYVIFFLMNIVNNIKENRKFVASEIAMLLSNNVFYYSAGMLILKSMDAEIYQGLFTALMGVFNFVFAYTLYVTKKADKNLVFLLIGLVLTFASLTAPIQLEGNYITMFWALEAVLLLWLSQKSGIQLIKISSILVTFLMVISWLMDWEKLYFPLYEEKAMTLFLNKAFVTSVVCLLSLLGTLQLLKKEGVAFLPSVELKFYERMIIGAFMILAYFTFFLEFNYQVDHHFEYSVGVLYIGSYNLAFGCVLLWWWRKIQESYAEILSQLVVGVLVIAYIAHYNYMAGDVRNGVLERDIDAFHYFYHYVLLSLMVVVAVLFSKRIFGNYSIASKPAQKYLCAYAAFFLFLTSAELEHFVVYFAFDTTSEASIGHLKHQVFRIGFPILWGLCSFLFMYLGMKWKVKTLRIISLVVFAITLLKLFIFDVSKMGEGGKIAAFICLGLLLLIISFMYQKLKKLIIEDTTK